MGRLTAVVHDNWLVLLVVGVLAGGYILLRTPGTEFASTEAFDQMVRSGQPVVVEFYTNT